MCDHVYTLAKNICIYIYIYLQLYYYLQHTRFAFYNVNQVETHSLLLKKVRGKEKKIRSKLRRWNHGKTSVKFCIVCGLRAESNSYSFRSQSNIVTWMWVAHEFFFSKADAEFVEHVGAVKTSKSFDISEQGWILFLMIVKVSN